ncbi:MAG: signal peptidase II [Candidatus Gracilibacteria bacterium]
MNKSILKIAVPASIFFVADQMLKWWAAAYLQSPLSLASWAQLRYEQNTGIAWSIAIPQPWLNILNVILLLILPLLISKSIDMRRNDSRFFLSMIVGGATGNLFDRLTRGYVIDFVAIGWWPVFNLADVLLTTGIFLILVFYGRIQRDSRTGSRFVTQKPCNKTKHSSKVWTDKWLIRANISRGCRSR